MKHIMVTYLILFTGILFADDLGKSILRQEYAIISDNFSSQVPKGKCLIAGKVVSPYYDLDGKQKPIEGAKIATLDQKKSCLTDSLGQFKLLLDATDTSIFMFAEGLDEIVIWKYAFRSQHVVQIQFYPGVNNSMMIVDKPVIYLYSEEEMEVELSLKPRSQLTFTYPVYEKGWKFTLNSAGLTHVASGRSYPYLFWEGETQNLDFVSSNGGLQGFAVKTDTVVSFLESSLDKMGLNQTEKTDFITFWGPRLQAKPYAFIQFIWNDLYAAKIAELEINPKPEAAFRVFMLYSPMTFELPSYMAQPQVLPTFQRKGFTLVEWGGSELPEIKPIP